MLNEGSGRIEGVSQENDNSVTIQANNFREGLKVVGLDDEGILIVQDENGQDVQITNENVKSIKEQNDLMAQREAERNKIKEDIKSIGSEKDTLEYMKKFYKEQYAKTNGKELPGNITIEFFNRDLNPTTIEEIVVKDARGEVVDSWKDSVESKDGSTLSTIGGSLMQIEQLRKYYRDSSPDSYLSRKGGEIIKKLEKIKYIDINSKTQIVTPTQKGEAIYDVVNFSMPDMLNAKLTASWEKGLDLVAKKEIKPDEFMTKLVNYINSKFNKLIVKT